MPAGWSDIQTQALALSGFLEEANITSADLLAVLEYKRYRGYLVDGIRSYANDLKKRGIIPSVVGNEESSSSKTAFAGLHKFKHGQRLGSERILSAQQQMRSRFPPRRGPPPPSLWPSYDTYPHIHSQQLTSGRSLPSHPSMSMPPLDLWTTPSDPANATHSGLFQDHGEAVAPFPASVRPQSDHFTHLWPIARSEPFIQEVPYLKTSSSSIEQLRGQLPHDQTCAQPQPIVPQQAASMQRFRSMVEPPVGPQQSPAAAEPELPAAEQSIEPPAPRHSPAVSQSTLAEPQTPPKRSPPVKTSIMTLPASSAPIGSRRQSDRTPIHKPLETIPGTHIHLDDLTAPQSWLRHDPQCGDAMTLLARIAHHTTEKGERWVELDFANGQWAVMKVGKGVRARFEVGSTAVVKGVKGPKRCPRRVLYFDAEAEVTLLGGVTVEDVARVNGECNRRRRTRLEEQGLADEPNWLVRNTRH